MTTKPNSIETRENMNCSTCLLQDRCCYFPGVQAKQAEDASICKFFYNPDKGCFDDSGKRKVCQK